MATANRGKLREIEALLGDRFDLVDLASSGASQAEETGLTFVENAILKARSACAHSLLPAIAEDSGLEVDALSGAPGIYSARYAGPGASDADNNARLLAELDSADNRSARYRCVAVAMRHETDPAPLICQGTWEGSIADAPRGDGGFGYDPLFVPQGATGTAAQMSAADKNRVSHRARALDELGRELADFLGRS